MTITVAQQIEQAADDMKDGIQMQIRDFEQKTGFKITGMEFNFSVLEFSNRREDGKRNVSVTLNDIKITHTGSTL